MQIQRPLSVFDFGIRGIAHGAHGVQRLKPDDHGPVKTLLAPALRMAGHFKVQVHRHGQLIREQEFDNLILNQGLEYLGTQTPGAANIVGFCHIGTGTSVPSSTQTALDAFVASSTSVGTNPLGTVFNTFVRSGSPNYTCTATCFFQFAQGAAVGNMSEIGISYKNTNGGLFSRALITDGSGNPTTITLTSIDQVSVYYSITYYPSMTPVAGSVTLGGTSYAFTSYMTNMNNFGSIAGSNTIMLSYASAYPFMSFTANQVGSSVSPCYMNAAGSALSGTVATDTQIPNPQGFTISNTQSSNSCTTSTAYTAGSYTNVATVAFPAISANLTGGIQSMQMCFQAFGAVSAGTQTGFNVVYYFTTPIPKNNTKQLTMVFSTTWGV